MYGAVWVSIPPKKTDVTAVASPRSWSVASALYFDLFLAVAAKFVLVVFVIRHSGLQELQPVGTILEPPPRETYTGRYDGCGNLGTEGDKHAKG